MFDFLTVYSIIGGGELILAAVVIFYASTTRHKRRLWYLFALQKLFDGFALIALGLHDSPYAFAPLWLSLWVLYLDWALLSIVAVSFRGELFKGFSTYALAVAMTVNLLYISYQDSGPGLVYLNTFAAVALFAPSAVYLYRYKGRNKFPAFMALCFGLYVVVNLVRVAVILSMDSGYDFFSFHIIDKLYILLSMGLIVVSTVAFFLLLSEEDQHIKFEQNRLNKVALEQSPLSILITDVKGRISYVNPALCRITGYQKHELIGQTPSLFKSGETPEQVYVSLWKTISNGNSWYGEFVNKKKNGDFYYEEAAISPLKDEYGHIDAFFSLKSDISYRKHQEATWLRKNEELQELDRTKNKLFSIIAHDLKNPIGGMMNILDLANEMKDENTAQAFEFVALAKDASKQSFDLLENLLNWSRSQLKAAQIHPIVFDLNDTIDSVVDLYQLNINAKRLILNKYYGLQASVLADEEMIRTVLRNLLSNAIKFTPEGGTLSLRTEQDGLRMRVSISDSGVGIEQSRLEKLFRFTENNSTHGTAGEKGTGLGLVLVKEFVELNQGQLTVESQLGTGSTFSFVLPRPVFN